MRAKKEPPEQVAIRGLIGEWTSTGEHELPRRVAQLANEARTIVASYRGTVRGKYFDSLDDFARAHGLVAGEGAALAPRGVGRPLAVAADAQFGIRAPRAEIEAWKRQAAAEGVSASEWARAKLNGRRLLAWEKRLQFVTSGDDTEPHLREWPTADPKPSK